MRNGVRGREAKTDGAGFLIWASIHDRPPEIEERLVPGHWEGDLIKGAQNRSAVGTLVERTTTLFTVLSRMDNASAEQH